ncbi:hypothetical protein CASFOL_018548 [Castilleja foliolosa]|uniref:Uncharacterized protein n=1 Tax=Castilleja foliolosa TaxID=1961234 RepID=A0ABD3D510_9LAMI
MDSLNKQNDYSEGELQKHWDENLYHKIGQLKEQLQDNVRWESQLLQQKSRITWLQEGDRNTSFYHAVIKDRRKNNIIAIEDGIGDITSDHKIVGEKVIRPYL